MAKLQSGSQKLYDVMLTSGVFLPGEDGRMCHHGPKTRGDTPVKVTVSQRIGRQIVQANRGFWAGEPPPKNANETATAEAEEVRGPSAAKKKATRGPTGV